MIGIYSTPVWLPQNFIVTVVSDVDRKQQHLILLDPASLVNVIQDYRNPKGGFSNRNNGGELENGLLLMDVDSNESNNGAKKIPNPSLDDDESDEEQARVIEMLSSSLGVDLTALLTMQKRKC